MRETNREQIRRALDECLSGMDGRPSLEKRVLARAKGERRGPRRLSLALAVALLMLLLAAAALAAGVLTGWLRLAGRDAVPVHQRRPAHMEAGAGGIHAAGVHGRTTGAGHRL